MTHDEGYVLPPNHPAFVSESYDELLAKINEGSRVCELDSPAWSALRAVVELHKPEVEDESFLVCSMCMDGDYTDGTHAYSLYPCETIEAIEKGLR